MPSSVKVVRRIPCTIASLTRVFICPDPGDHSERVAVQPRVGHRVDRRMVSAGSRPPPLLRHRHHPRGLRLRRGLLLHHKILL